MNDFYDWCEQNEIELPLLNERGLRTAINGPKPEYQLGPRGPGQDAATNKGFTQADAEKGGEPKKSSPPSKKPVRSGSKTPEEKWFDEREEEAERLVNRVVDNADKKSSN